MGKKILALFALMILISPLAKAKHIIGGVMYYEFVRSPSAGVNTYKITLKVYRDCVPAPDKAGFDDPASVAIGMSDGTYFRRNFNMTRPIISPFSNQSTNNCQLLPPGLCVEEGVYTRNIDLPVDATKSYYIVYQRCCRNNTIFNIISPGQVGATFYVEITPAAQLAQSSCPQFKNFPPLAICAGYSLEFDHSAKDIDGDSLAYEFTAPLAGGGMNNGNGCDALTPTPPCLPPYDDLRYRNPYSPTNPMGGNPALAIDPVTGFLSGKPEVIGQFVVGVKVKEYRNGVLLSENIRDFQFNVTECISVTSALLSGGDSIGESIDFFQCGDNRIVIKNKSIATPNSDYEWQFYYKGDTLIYDTFNFTIDVPESGIFSGIMIINKGLECTDTAQFKFSKYPGLNADYSFQFDTCVGKDITIKNLSTSDGGKLSIYEWNINNINFSNQKEFNFKPDSSGSYKTQLIVEDVNGCRDSIQKDIDYFPIFTREQRTSEKLTGCIPYAAKLEVLEDLNPIKYTAKWDFGDGTDSSGFSTIHSYNNAGNYDVELTISNQYGCEYTKLLKRQVTTYNPPTAGFEYLPTNPNSHKNKVQLLDMSTGGIDWSYIMPNGDTLSGANQNVILQDTGLNPIKQIVENQYGCLDTLSKIIDVTPFNVIYLPNAFTPGIDGKNDTYRPAGINSSLQEYSLKIFDRWGNNVFSSTDWKTGWNGTDQNGLPLPASSYAVSLKAKSGRGEVFEMKGVVLLIR